MAADLGQPHSGTAQHRGAPVHATSAQDIFALIDPEEFAQHLAPITRRMIKDVINEIRVGVSAYDRPLEGEFGKVIVTSVEKAIHHVIDNLGSSEVDRTGWEEWFRELGRRQFRSGTSMDVMHSAVGIGTQVAWRHLRVSGESLGVPTGTLFTFADGLFKYSDELAATVSAGYAEAAANSRDGIDHRRRRLHRLLVSGEAESRQALVELASATDWPLPEHVGVVAIEHDPARTRNVTPELGSDVLVDLDGTVPSLVMSDPEQYVDALREELACRRLAVGPVVAVEEAHTSFNMARQALELAERGHMPDEEVIMCADRLADLAISSDEYLLRRISETALAPLSGLTPKQRARMSETLLAWLGVNDGCVTDIAERLGVHPQTVRYRLGKLRELFGESLDDPEQRLRLEMALRAPAEQ
ncbi:PucR family transcriptional regulator [Haloechinothrix alba]|uniref:PucR family transcriptional regulator n=1 Tax=Haloechinothrix alba TaxID=664784 RepID=UPI000B775BFF|nr:PucR family transcriptional regulator [Haloechinothrix alba]